MRRDMTFSSAILKMYGEPVRKGNGGHPDVRGVAVNAVIGVSEKFVQLVGLL